MSANPLMTAQDNRPPRTLEGFVEKVNREEFVAHSGRYYFINQRILANGETLRFVDRHEG